jgi:hypothetical protein
LDQEKKVMSNEPIDARDAAFRRLKAHRDFWAHLFTYVVFNSALVIIWYVTGRGYFWPGWLIGLWGAGLVMHGWDAWLRRPITEQEIRREMERQGGSHA